MDKTKNEKSEKKIKSIFAKLATKIILRIVTIACIAVAVMFGGKFGWKKFTQVRVEKKHAMVERSLLESAELVLYKMRYSDIVAIKKKRAASNAYSLIRYAGIIRAGIEDISKSEIIVSDNGKKLVVKIPPTTLIGNEIYSQEVFDERQGLFAKITTQEVFEEIAAAKEEAAREILAEGLLDDADARAALVIKQLLAPIGFDNIVVELK